MNKVLALFIINSFLLIKLIQNVMSDEFLYKKN